MWRSLDRGLTGAALILTLAAGCRAPESVMGRPPAGPSQPVAAVKTADLESTITVSGKLVEKCPVAGCWFDLKDSTGVLRVDTKAAGFTVLEVPLGRRLRVTGKVKPFGAERQLIASGLVY